MKSRVFVMQTIQMLSKIWNFYLIMTRLIMGQLPRLYMKIRGIFGFWLCRLKIDLMGWLKPDWYQVMGSSFNCLISPSFIILDKFFTKFRNILTTPFIFVYFFHVVEFKIPFIPRHPWDDQLISNVKEFIKLNINYK